MSAFKCNSAVAVAIVVCHVTYARARESATTEPTTQPVIEIHRALHPIKIDGDLGKPEWQNVASVPVDYINSKQGVLSDVPRMKARFLWDEHYLYIGYEFFTKNLKAQGNGRRKGPPGNERDGAEIWLAHENVDIAEFFISFSDPNFFWEIHHNELNQFNDVWITVPDPSWRLAQQANIPFGIIFGQDFLQDEGPYTLATAVKLLPKADGNPSTVNDPSDVDTGYAGEIRLPWYGLGAPTSRRGDAIKLPLEKGETQPRTTPGPWKMAGARLNILAVYQDMDLPDRYHHSSPTKPAGGWFHLSQEYWPHFEIVQGN